jgi:hypothetical protein
MSNVDKRADRVKILVSDRTGLVLVHKRLEAASSFAQRLRTARCGYAAFFAVQHDAAQGVLAAWKRGVRHKIELANRGIAAVEKA